MKKHLALTPKQQAKLERQANALAAKGEIKVAAQTLLPVAETLPHEVTHWLQIARWQREARDFSAAAQTLQTAIRHQIQHQRTSARKTKSTGQKTDSSKIAASHLNQPNSSARDKNAAPQSSTRKAEERDFSGRDLALLWLELSEVQAEAQDWAQCIASCHALLKIAPRHHLAREILATALLHSEQLAETETVLRELLVLSPRDPLHRLKLATLLQMQGKSGEALREFERVVETYPEAPFAEEAREAIDLLDHLQMQQVLMRAGEQPIFHQQMQNALEQTLNENGFHLTDEGRESLRHMMSDGRLAPEPERVRLH